MTLGNDRAHDRAELLYRVVGIDDVPNLDVVRLLLRQLLDQFYSLFRRIDLHDRRIIIEDELRPRDTGDKWTGYSYSRRFLRRIGFLAHAEVPHRTTYI